MNLLLILAVWFVASVPATFLVARLLANQSRLLEKRGAPMPTFVYYDATTGRSKAVILPDGCEPCMMCNGLGHWDDEWGEHRCEECEGEGIVETGCERDYISLSVEDEGPENAPLINDPGMYENPLL